YESREFGRALRAVMSYADRVNEFFDAQKPWELAKDPARHAELHRVCSESLAAFYRMTIFLKPVLPNVAQAVESWLGTPALGWKDLSTRPERIGAYRHLMQRIDSKQIDALLEGPKAAIAPPAATSAKAAANAAPASAHAATEKPGTISIDDFAKVELR